LRVQSLLLTWLGRRSRKSVKRIHGKALSFGRDYILPSPFDPLLLSGVAPAVMRAAIETGLARNGVNVADTAPRLAVA
jgi:malic enzyme